MSSSEDIYDFSDISYHDLVGPASTVMMGNTMATNFDADDDEEWYPPSPAPYDVTDKLIEANERLRNDPVSDIHVAHRLRWRPDQRLVEIRWLDPLDPEERVNFLSSTESVVVIDDLSSLHLTEVQAQVHQADLASVEDDSDLNPLPSEGSGLGTATPPSPSPSPAPPSSVAVDVSRGNKSSSSSDDDVDVEADENEATTTSRVAENKKSPVNSANTKRRSSSGHKTSSASANSSSTSLPPPPASTTPPRVVLHQRKPPPPTCTLTSADEPRPKPLLGARHDHRSARRSSLDDTDGVSANHSTSKQHHKSRHPHKGYLSRDSGSHSSYSSSDSDRMPNSQSLPDLHSRSNSSSPAVPVRLKESSTIIPIAKAVYRPLSSNTLTAPPLLRRKISRNSLSSNSSLSSHSTGTEDSDTTRALRAAQDQAYGQWLQRKKEEKRLRERRAFLQLQKRIKQSY